MLDLIINLRRAETIYRKRGMPLHAAETHRARGALFDARHPETTHARNLIQGAYA